MDAQRRRDDTKLAQMAAQGDRSALCQLIRKYYARTHRFVLYHGVNELDAEDVTQNIYLSLLESISHFSARSSFPTWFRRLEKARIKDYFRELLRSRGLSAKTAARAQYADKTERDDVIEYLPERYRDVLKRRFWERKEYSQIAKEYGISVEAARSLCRRAVKDAAKYYNAIIATEKGKDVDNKKQVNAMLLPEEYEYIKRFKISQRAVFRALLRLMQQKGGRSVTRDDLVLGLVKAKLGIL